MQTTSDDKVRLICIVYGEADLRVKIPELTRRQSYGRNAALTVILSRFTDENHQVRMPNQWFDVATASAIDEHRGDGFFAQHGTFNPNNNTRIRQPWTKGLLDSLLDNMTAEYNKCMKMYTWGTGGGSGYYTAVWQDRSETVFDRYVGGQSRLYLTLMHMFDKRYGYPFFTPIEQPYHYQIQGGDDDDDDEDVGTVISL